MSINVSVHYSFPAKTIEKWLANIRDRYAKVTTEGKGRSEDDTMPLARRNQYIKTNLAQHTKCGAESFRMAHFGIGTLKRAIYLKKMLMENC